MFSDIYPLIILSYCEHVLNVCSDANGHRTKSKSIGLCRDPSTRHLDW